MDRPIAYALAAFCAVAVVVSFVAPPVVAALLGALGGGLGFQWRKRRLAQELGNDGPPPRSPR